MKRTKLLQQFVSYCNHSDIQISVMDNRIINYPYYSIDFRFENRIFIWDKCNSRKYDYECSCIEELIIILGNKNHQVSRDFKLNGFSLNEYQEPLLIDFYILTSSLSYNLPYKYFLT